MRHVPRVSFDGREWDDWIAECKKAADAVKAAKDRSKAIKSKEHVYKAAVPFLKRLFGEKCAYCEAPFDSGRLEVEHFRPKLRACDQHNKVIKAKQGGNEVEHAGYYWLAFTWENLLPGCTACNQLPAKANKFPLASAGTRAWKPTDTLDDEEPLLLDPCRDNPEDHLDFDTTGRATGCVSPKANSARGRVSIEVYHLNRDGLRVARMSELFAIRKAQVEVVSAESLGIADFSDAVEEIRVRCGADRPHSALWTTKTRDFLRFADQRLKALTASSQDTKAG